MIFKYIYMKTKKNYNIGILLKYQYIHRIFKYIYMKTKKNYNIFINYVLFLAFEYHIFHIMIFLGFFFYLIGNSFNVAYCSGDTSNSPLIIVGSVTLAVLSVVGYGLYRFLTHTRNVSSTADEIVITPNDDDLETVVEISDQVKKISIKHIGKNLENYGSLPRNVETFKDVAFRENHEVLTYTQLKTHLSKIETREEFLDFATKLEKGRLYISLDDIVRLFYEYKNHYKILAKWMTSPTSPIRFGDLPLQLETGLTNSLKNAIELALSGKTPIQKATSGTKLVEFNDELYASLFEYHYYIISIGDALKNHPHISSYKYILHSESIYFRYFGEWKQLYSNTTDPYIIKKFYNPEQASNFIKNIDISEWAKKWQDHESWMIKWENKRISEWDKKWPDPESLLGQRLSEQSALRNQTPIDTELRSNTSMTSPYEQFFIDTDSFQNHLLTLLCILISTMVYSLYNKHYYKEKKIK